MRGFVQVDGVVHIASQGVLRKYGKVFGRFDLLIDVLFGDVFLMNVLFGNLWICD